MKDRFKFRVWNKRDKKMIYNAEDVYDGSLSGFCENENNNNDGHISCFGEYLGRDDEYIVMQSTGLKDKNGKLIYEGDILKFYSQSIIDAMAGEPLKERIGVAVWNEEELKFDVSVDNGKNIVPNLCKKTDDNNFEIIGNIYENKELLEEQK